MDISDGQADALRRWAQKTPQVRCLYLFGSRAKGTSRPDSDADIALRFMVPDEMVEDVFRWNHDKWFFELRAATGLPVTLHHLAGRLTPKHEAYLAECNVLIFDRANDKR